MDKDIAYIALDSKGAKDDIEWRVIYLYILYKVVDISDLEKYLNIL